MPMSNEIEWPEITQTRLYHSVRDAIKILKESPREVEDMPLAGWKEGANGPNRFIVGPGVLPAFYGFDHIAKVADNIPPVILAEVNGKTFVLDGAHRLAKWIMLKRPTIPMLRLTAAESKACIRAGMEEKVAALKV
ncbi:MAG: hypothetical protein AB7K24_17820 [Gemmataceae bacterium]